MSFRALRLIAYLILGAIVIITFIPCVGNDFVNWDDLDFVVDNQNITELSSKSLLWMITTSYQGIWHPLTWLSHAMDRALWGVAASYHHLTNVLIHVITSLLVASLFVKLQEARGVPRESAYIAAFVGALLFGVHPLRVESVAWVSERKDVLCALFTISSLLFYLDYAMASKGRKRRLYYLLSLGSFILAMMSKPMAMTLPLILLVLDFFPLGRLNVGAKRQVFIEKIPFFIVAVGTAILNMWAASGAGMVSFSYVPLYMRTMNAFYAIVFYLKQSIFPQDLVPLYQLDRGLDYFGPRYMISMILVIGVTAACVWKVTKNNRFWVALWFSYLISLAPVLGFFMSYRHAVADRYSYLPTLGLWLLVGLATARLWGAFGRLRYGPRVARAALIGCMMIVAFAYALYTHNQIGIWKNNEVLWRHVMTHAEHIPALAFYHQGRELEKKGNTDHAFAYYRKAHELDPSNPDYTAHVARITAKKGDPETALEMFKEIAKRHPEIALYHRNVGRMYFLLQRYDEAILSLEQALQIAPEDGSALFWLAATYFKKGDRNRAISYYEQYLSMGYARSEELDLMFDPAKN